MRKLFLMLAAVTALAVAGPAGAATTKTVNIFGSAFSPKSITITEGDTVTWVNRDNANHQILAQKGEFVSSILRPRQTFSFTFNAAGTYPYKDELNTKLRGTVVVKGLPPTLTLAVTSQFVVFGDKVTLSGAVSSHKAGEQVTIYYQPYPQPNLIQLATVLTGTGGAFSYIVTPQIATNYQATWKGAYATPTSVQVQPRLTIGRNNGWILHAYAGRTFAGRAVQFQRLNTVTGQWVTLKKALLNAKSSAKFTIKLPKGLNQLRVTMSVNQAGAGFLGAISPVVKWRQLT
ncbi:MAG: cupredoxin domain-containing protein [Gaiellaceae bacterium]